MRKEIENILNDLREKIADNPASAAEKKYDCSKCKDIGWIRIADEEGHTFMKHCDCWGIREAGRLMELSGISAEYRRKTFENFETKNIAQLVNAKNKAIKYMQDFEQNEKTRYNSIIFCGQVGAGKTHLGIAICNKLMSNNVRVSYMSYRNTITKIKQVITDEGEYEEEIAKYMQARVLYIDDFLKGRITESDVNILYEIVNYRYMNNLPFIISTEKSIDEMIKFDEAIASRIIEMCRSNIVLFKGGELNYRLN